jgi:outer membrane protein OmpA-like peptidoglycan-associated protein
VKHYLVSKGVMADRLDAVGKGESQPIAPNTKPNGKDNPEGRAMNRRAELKVR